jgi:hypothetical protein
MPTATIIHIAVSPVPKMSRNSGRIAILGIG